MPLSRLGSGGSLRSAKGIFVVLTTVASEREAVRLAHGLVRSRSAACVNVVPRVQSCYWWQGKVEAGREALLLIKTTARCLRPLCRQLERMHSYEVPEILAVPVAGGGASYLCWLQAVLAKPGSASVWCHPRESEDQSSSDSRFRGNDDGGKLRHYPKPKPLDKVR